MTNTKYLLQIHQSIIKFFNEEEFNQFCFLFNVEYGHLAGRSFPDKALDFVKRVERQGVIRGLGSLRAELLYIYRSILEHWNLLSVLATDL